MSLLPLARAHAQLQALARPARPEATVKASAEVTGTGADGEPLATVFIYDEIGGFGISAAQLVPQLAALDAAEIAVRLNSPGGDYFDGVAIANALAEHPGRILVHVDGLAASAASVIAMAGDEVVMHPGARMMIHDALTLTIGNAGDHTTTAALLDGVSADIAELYTARAGGEAGVWREAMRAESWYTADEAVRAGLAHRAVSRETTADPVPAGQWHELVALWRMCPPPQNLESVVESTSDEDVPAVAELPTVAVLPLSELLCSAYREDV